MTLGKPGRASLAGPDHPGQINHPRTRQLAAQQVDFLRIAHQGGIGGGKGPEFGHAHRLGLLAQRLRAGQLGLALQAQEVQIGVVEQDARLRGIAPQQRHHPFGDRHAVHIGQREGRAAQRDQVFGPGVERMHDQLDAGVGQRLGIGGGGGEVGGQEGDRVAQRLQQAHVLEDDVRAGVVVGFRHRLVDHQGPWARRPGRRQVLHVGAADHHLDGDLAGEEPVQPGRQQGKPVGPAHARFGGMKSLFQPAVVVAQRDRRSAAVQPYPLQADAQAAIVGRSPGLKRGHHRARQQADLSGRTGQAENVEALVHRHRRQHLPVHQQPQTGVADQFRLFGMRFRHGGAQGCG